jgi:hypothetical protein
MTGATVDWKDEARDLREQGLSERAIAEAVGKAPSSVHEALAGSNGHGDARELEREAGPAVGAMPTPGQQTIDGGEVSASIPMEEIRVDGTTQLGMFSAGGKQPASASLRLSGGKILLVDGQAFRKGDTISFSGTAVVREVGQRDKPDPATGIVVSAEQKHVAQITDLRVNST